MRRSPLANLAALAALALAPAGQAQPMSTMGNRPVTISSPEEGLDPCALGMINDPPTGPDVGAVMVFPGDSTELAYVDTLEHGFPVWICDGSEGWYGIVYSRDPDRDCGITSPEGEPRPYLGPCDWGWVKEEWVEFVAG